MKLTIAIVSYNAKEYLLGCLRSIENGTKGIEYEVIVVDNASKDPGTKEVRQEFPKISMIENKRNVGFSAANNQAIKLAKGEYVLLLNHDTKVSEGSLLKLVEFLDKHPEAGACGAKVLNSDGTVQHQCKRGFPTPLSTLCHMSGLNRVFPGNKLFGHYLMTYLDTEKVAEVDALSGACMLIRRKILEDIGGMDESFFLYGEDIDVCYRIKEKGWKIFYVPSSRIVHFGGVGSRSMSYRSIREFYRSMKLFYNKHYSRKYPKLLKSLVFLGINLKMVSNIILNVLRREKFGGTKKP